jgi:hypothetical protein
MDIMKISLAAVDRVGDIAVRIVTGYRLDDSGGRSSSPSRVNNFHFSISSRLALGPTQPPIQWVQGDLSPGRETDRSPRTSTEVEKT